MADVRDLSPMLVGESPALLGDDLCISGRQDADANTLHQIHANAMPRCPWLTRFAAPHVSTRPSSSTKTDLAEVIKLAPMNKGLGWANIAELIGTDWAWTTAALVGQHPLSDYIANVGFVGLPLFHNAFHVSPPHRGISRNPGSRGLADVTVDPSQPPQVDFMSKTRPGSGRLINAQPVDAISST
jgi:hypothetical protein